MLLISVTNRSRALLAVQKDSPKAVVSKSTGVATDYVMTSNSLPTTPIVNGEVGQDFIDRFNNAIPLSDRGNRP